MFRLRRPSTLNDAPSIQAPGVGGELDTDAARDDRLARAAQGGDLAAFNTLVTRHERPVYALCYRMLRDAMHAEDTTQETFLKAWASIDSFHGGLFRSWLLRIATNRCYDVLRAQSRRPAGSFDAQEFEVEPIWTSQAVQAEEPERFAIRAELAVALERALSQLPDDQRLVIVLSDLQGHSYDEISRITGVAVGTVKSRISRARGRLREALQANERHRELLGAFGRSYDEQDESNPN